MKILYKLTSRSRPENCLRALNSIIDNVVNPDYMVLISLDKDDALIEKYMDLLFPLHVTTFVEGGTSRNKVDAINRDVEKFKVFDILVNVSDDQIFTLKGFDERIRSYARHYADTDFFLHFPDSNHKPWDALCTLSIIGRKYYERDGYIYHPSYESVYCDNEAQEVAKRRNRYMFCPEYIFDHLHCAYGKAPIDAQYKKTESLAIHRKDKMNFERRKRVGFPA